MNVWGITHHGVVRGQNQDAFAFRELEDGRIIALVCDGMGGARAGNIASTMAVDVFMEEFFHGQALLHETDQQRMERAAVRANAEVYRRASTQAECAGMGTTLVAVLTDGRNALVLNEGDSRAYYTTPAYARRITRDHSLVEDLVQRGDLTREQARRHPHKNVITRALGTDPRLRADAFHQELEEGSFLLLCSDGLSNLLTEQELQYEVIRGGPAGECCQRLLDLALERGAPDNVTAVLIRCGYDQE